MLNNDSNNPFAGEANLGTDAALSIYYYYICIYIVIDQGSANPFSPQTSCNELKAEMTTYEKVLLQDRKSVV